MIKKTISQKDVITFMNELLNTDYEAINNLINSRVKCNESIAEHPTVQVSVNKNGDCFVGLLGILNGLFGIDNKGMGAFAIYMDTKGNIKKFDTCNKIDEEMQKHKESLSKQELAKERKDILKDLPMWTKNKKDILK